MIEQGYFFGAKNLRIGSHTAPFNTGIILLAEKHNP
ncbi:hypothetical protein EMIT091MI3_130105 [Kosakonia quasisacchari]